MKYKKKVCFSTFQIEKYLFFKIDIRFKEPEIICELVQKESKQNIV